MLDILAFMFFVLWTHTLWRCIRTVDQRYLSDRLYREAAYTTPFYLAAYRESAQ